MVREAQQGFRVALCMDVTVFAVGVVLLLCSAAIALARDDFGSWATAGASGGCGVLGILYATLVAQPRKQVIARSVYTFHIAVYC